MKTLRQAVGDYLSLRHSLGFKLKTHERYLRERTATTPLTLCLSPRVHSMGILLPVLPRCRESEMTIRGSLVHERQHVNPQSAGRKATSPQRGSLQPIAWVKLKAGSLQSGYPASGDRLPNNERGAFSCPCSETTKTPAAHPWRVFRRTRFPLAS